jgi:transporter family protein
LNVPQLLGIGLSLAAIYLFNAPGDEGFFSPWLIYSMVPIVLWGVCGLLQKMSTNHLSARASAIWFLLAFVPLAGVIIMVAPVPSGIPIQTWALAAGVGFTLALGNFTILLAFASGGKASIITPMTGLYFLVSIPIAIVAFDEEFVWREGLGMACALLAIVLLSYQSEPENPQSATTGTGAAP